MQMQSSQNPQPSKPKKLPREGFRRRHNPYYGNMTKRQITADVSKDTAKWLVVTLLAYGYWLLLLLLLSIILLSIWHVTFVQILLYSGILCAITSVIYACMLVHRKFYY